MIVFDRHACGATCDNERADGLTTESTEVSPSARFPRFDSDFWPHGEVFSKTGSLLEFSDELCATAKLRPVPFSDPCEDGKLIRRAEFIAAYQRLEAVVTN